MPRSSRVPNRVEKEAKFRELVSTGHLMANLCYNIGQPSWTLSEHDRETMKTLQKRWDAAYRDFCLVRESTHAR